MRVTTAILNFQRACLHKVRHVLKFGLPAAASDINIMKTATRRQLLSVNR